MMIFVWMSRAKPDPEQTPHKSDEFALADRESEGESEGCKAQILNKILINIL